MSSGTLPEGVALLPNGEIYGVPRETGEFPIQVTMENSVNDFPDSTATFTLKILENTDANVEGQTDTGYKLTTRLPATVTLGSNRTVVSDGAMGEFIDLLLDGQKLVEGADYEKSEGSTIVNANSQVFQNAGSGTHTLAFEFRINGNVNLDLKKAAQNFTIGSTGGDDSGSSSGSGGDSVPSTSISTPSTSGGSTTVSMTTTAVTSGTTARAEISSPNMNRAVSSAIAEAAKQGTVPVVEVKVIVSANAKSLNLTLPTDSLKTLADAEGSSLVITSNVVEATLDHIALAALVGNAAGSTIVLQFAPVDTSTLGEVQRETVVIALVIDLALASGDVAIHDYGSGTITVTLPYTPPAGQGTDDIVVYYLDDNGNLTPCATSYANGKVTFVTSHLSRICHRNHCPQHRRERVC